MKGPKLQGFNVQLTKRHTEVCAGRLRKKDAMNSDSPTEEKPSKKQSQTKSEMQGWAQEDVYLLLWVLADIRGFLESKPHLLLSEIFSSSIGPYDPLIPL